MKIAVSAQEPDLNAQVDPRFGRCQYFVIVDTETMEFETMKNTGTDAGGGAGIAAAQLVTGTEPEVVLTGSCGPNAFSVLEAAGIKVVTGVSGTIRKAIDDYVAGKYTPASEANAQPHSGMKNS
jgi:predicted Fe-Mo cluster-binding NifX family protein